MYHENKLIENINSINTDIKKTKPTEFKIENIVEKINNGKKLTNEEEKFFDLQVKQNLDLKYKKIDNNKKSTSTEKYRYSKEELEFIANPKEVTKEELGIINTENKEKSEKKVYTEEELEAIANPKK